MNFKRSPRPGKAVIAALALAALGALAAGCTLSPAAPSQPLGPGKGSMTIYITQNISSARTLLPGTDLRPTSYILSGIGPGAEVFSQDAVEGANSIANIGAGAWVITATALNASAEIIGSGSAAIAVTIGRTASASITLAPLSGNGTLTVNLTWPSGSITTPVVFATLKPIDGSHPIDLAFIVGANSASFASSSIPSGYYTLIITLDDCARVVAGKAEMVRLVKDQTTSGIYDFTQVNSGNVEVEINPNFAQPLSVSLSGGQDLLALGGYMSLFALVAGNPGTLVFAWYDNGIIKMVDGPTWNCGSSLSLGYHLIDVTACTADGKQGGSASIQVLVTTAVEKAVTGANFDPNLVPDLQIAKAASLKFYMEHGSVGQGIAAGLTALKAQEARYSSGGVTWTSSYPDSAADPLWFDTHSGLGDNNRGNPDAAGKLAFFQSSMGGALGAKVDAAMFEFGYGDSPAGIAEADGFFITVRTAMEGLEAASPGIHFVWTTMPLQTVGDAYRQEYNDQVRTYCAANGKWLYDIAAIESHDDNGMATLDAGGNELLYSGYSLDGGNPNAAGSLKLAKAYWKLIAEIAVQ